VLRGDVVDEFLYDHGLAHTGAAEETGLTPPLQRAQDIHGLDPRLEDLRDGGLLGQGDLDAVDRPALLFGEALHIVDGVSEDVEYPTEEFLAHGNQERLAGVDHLRASGQALGGPEGDAPDHLVVELHHDLDTYPAVVAGTEDVANGGKTARGKAGIDYAAPNGNDGSLILFLSNHLGSLSSCNQSAA